MPCSNINIPLEKIVWQFKPNTFLAFILRGCITNVNTACTELSPAYLCLEAHVMIIIWLFQYQDSSLKAILAELLHQLTLSSIISKCVRTVKWLRVHRMTYFGLHLGKVKFSQLDGCKKKGVVHKLLGSGPRVCGDRRESNRSLLTWKAQKEEPQVQSPDGLCWAQVMLPEVFLQGGGNAESTILTWG